MNAITNLAFASHGNMFDAALSLEAVRQRAPAVFAMKLTRTVADSPSGGSVICCDATRRP